MNKEEAVKILNLPEQQPKVNPEEVMKRFEKLYVSNNPKTGGSFYLQTKIYFAKEYLMAGHPELNKSKFNPGGESDNTTEQKEEKQDSHNTSQN